MENSKCLITILKKLKSSSKEAIEGPDNFSDFKEYLHVERNIQTEFERLLKCANEVQKPQLILVCGSVGDGKSHMISYVKKNRSEIINNFYIHNDATESLDPRKTSIETLNTVLDAFSDENLGKKYNKTILAINLGTLTNFIDSEYGSRFTKFRNYIQGKKILDQEIVENNYDCESYFQFVNFTDYHLFSLTEQGAKSEYMQSIINKVFSNSFNNPFYKEYKETCCNACENYSRCPIKENYETLMKPNVQDAVIHKIIETIIKNKVIISTRALLNFIYDILVDYTLDNLPEDKLKSKIQNNQFMDYLNALMINIIFNNKDTSQIIASMSNLDPLSFRSETLDQLLINLYNTEKISNYFINYINNNPNHYYYKLLVVDEELEVLKGKKGREEIKPAVIKYFIRLAAIMGTEKANFFEDVEYHNYIKHLYHSNRRDKNEMKELLSFVKEIVYKWSGAINQSDQVQLMIGRIQSKFRVYEKLEFDGYIDGWPKQEDELQKFIKTINLTYQTKNGASENHSISIDFLLYSLINKIKEGYRPNRSDKNNFINFVDFVKTLQEKGSNREKIIFTKRNGDTTRSLELKLDEYGDYCLTEM